MRSKMSCCGNIMQFIMESVYTERARAHLSSRTRSQRTR